MFEPYAGRTAVGYRFDIDRAQRSDDACRVRTAAAGERGRERPQGVEADAPAVRETSVAYEFVLMDRLRPKERCGVMTIRERVYPHDVRTGVSGRCIDISAQPPPPRP